MKIERTPQHSKSMRAASRPLRAAGESDVHQREVRPLRAAASIASAGSRAIAITRWPASSTRSLEVQRDEHLVFDDQYGGRHDTADCSGKVTWTA